MYNIVLVGIDGSKYSEEALEVAINIAKVFGSKLAIVTVYAFYRTYMIDEPPPIPPEKEKMLKQMLAKYEGHAREAGIKDVETRLISTWNSPGAGLVKEAEKMGCALIVVGSRGISGIKRTLMGSVSSYVVKHAHCDVHVVRQ